MNRPVRCSLIAICVILALFMLPIDVSAQKKRAKRKHKTARIRPVIVTPPLFFPALDDGGGMVNSANPSFPAGPLAGKSGITNEGNGDLGSEKRSKGALPTKPLPLAVTALGLIISEFRLTGPNGVNDEFIEIYNDFGADHTVAASTGTGYGIAASDGIVRCIIPNGTVIPARGHFLCTNSVGYSLSTYPSGNNGVSATTATGDATYVTGITDGEDPDGAGGNPPLARQGIALFNTSVPGDFAIGTRFDAVGPASEANTLYREGAGLPNLTPFSTNQAWVRDECGKGGAVHLGGPCTIFTPKDTDDNAADFFYVDTNGFSAGGGQRLGAPGPQNLSSPILRNSSIPENLLDSTVAKSSPPNRVRDFTSDPGNNSTFGTLAIRRRFVNNTGASITRLRFRIIDIDTFPQSAGFADLRARNSSLVVIAGVQDPATCFATGAPATPPCTVSAQGTTVDVSTPVGTGQPFGGAFNSSLSAGTVTLGTPLANGASINLIFLFGLQQTGAFRVYVNVEALP